MRKSLKVSTFVLQLALIGALSPGLANAQEADGFGIGRFEPAERGSEWFTADSLDLRGHGRFAGGLVMDWAHKPLVIENPDGTETPLVQNQLLAHVGGSVVLWERLRFGATVPLALYQSGEDASINGDAYAAPNSAAFGDVRLGADVRILGAFREAFSLAAGIRAWLPTGSRGDYMGDGAIRLGGHVIAAGEISRFVYSARVGVTYRNLQQEFGGSPLGTDMPFSAAAGVRLLDDRLVVGPELHGSTVLVDGGAFLATATPLELLFGGHFTANCFRFGAGVGPGLTDGIGAAQVRGLLSLEYVAPFVEDADGDGVQDDHDVCPNVAGESTGDPARLGCPADRDSDGIEDARDACPASAGPADPDLSKNGCPLPVDADQDGVLDEVDRCPTVAGNGSTDGCPIPDTDEDGVGDPEDACPTRAGPKDADPSKNGCPVPVDDDGDRIENEKDACPQQAGSESEEASKNGCPRALVQGDRVDLSENVKFETGSADLVSGSESVLTDIARAIKTLPEVKKIRIEGHTDNVGGKLVNKGLSQRRAETVLNWLVVHGGINRDRLRALGWGDSKPLAPNNSAENKTANRRVEFHVE